MRALIAGGVIGLSLATVASAGEPSPALTLRGPPATRFGHRIDLRGRLSPAMPGARIRLLRNGAFVAATAVRADGTFRIRLRIGRPGPFRAVWQSISSNPVTIRIHPSLKTSLAGSRVAGRPLTLFARLRPSHAGRVRVQVLRNRETFDGTFARRARVRLGTTNLEPFRVRVESIPAPGFARVSRLLEISLRAPLLALGARGPLVHALLRRLAPLGYAIPGPRSVFDGDVLQSVYAFQKAQGLPRTGTAGAALWRKLERPLRPTPRYRLPSDHIEIDKRRQILLLVRGGRVALIVPVSTGGIPGYFTPVGRFAISRKVPGYDPSPLGILYKPMYFVGGYAIHGNPSVPPYPASHGCVRVPIFVIERLYRTEPYGEAVYIY